MRFVIVGLAASLSACAAVWGAAYKVESATSTEVVIRYDAALTDSAHIVAHANERCAQYHKIAVAKSQRLGVLIRGGSMAEITFDCDTQQEAAYDIAAPLRDGHLVFRSQPVPINSTFPTLATPMPVPTMAPPHTAVGTFDPGYADSPPPFRPQWCPADANFGACPRQ